ncbi:MAG: hypothetical protein FJZ01_17255 [Candidatus Sericytochromatia bacterium]|nr:hypothetical protein [Candidatus Tanganyikabacteria bacterium]
MAAKVMTELTVSSLVRELSLYREHVVEVDTYLRSLVLGGFIGTGDAEAVQEALQGFGTA